MTIEQESRLSMYLATRDYLVPNSSIIKGLPSFQENFTSFQSTIMQIQDIAEQQKIDKTGITEGKNQLRMALAELAADNSRKLTAFAKLNNNPTLLGEVKFNESDLKRCADTALKDYSQIVYDRAQANISALADYGITEATQNSLLNAINAYNASIAKPKIGITERSQATKQLVVLFKMADASLSNMDATVEIIRLAQPNFYNGYKAVRKVVETGAGSLALRGCAIDVLTGEPVMGVTFKFFSDENTDKETAAHGNASLIKKTAEKGSFNVKNINEGVYQVRVTKPGYKEKIITVSVAEGEMTDLRVGLEKV
jgi:hypothetical protein